jgi:hypothetical protein
MRRSGLATSGDTSVAEAKQADVEEDEFEDEYGATPFKPSHLEFGKSTITEGDMAKLLKLSYFSEDKRERSQKKMRWWFLRASSKQG